MKCSEMKYESRAICLDDDYDGYAMEACALEADYDKECDDDFMGEEMLARAIKPRAKMARRASLEAEAMSYSASPFAMDMG